MQGGALLANSRPVVGVFIVGVLGITFAVLGRGEFSIPPYQFFNPWRTDMIHIIGIIAQTIFAFIPSTFFLNGLNRTYLKPSVPRLSDECPHIPPLIVEHFLPYPSETLILLGMMENVWCTFVPYSIQRAAGGISWLRHVGWPSGSGRHARGCVRDPADSRAPRQSDRALRQIDWLPVCRAWGVQAPTGRRADSRERGGRYYTTVLPAGATWNLVCRERRSSRRCSTFSTTP